MRTAYEKLMIFALVLGLAVLLFAPMRSGIEDSLTLTPEHLELAAGDTAKLTYVLRTETAQTVAFSTDHPDVLYVDAYGNVRALNAGTANVRAQASGGASAETTVEVSGVPIMQISMNTPKLNMNKGDVSGLMVYINGDIPASTVVWSSLDPEVAKVDAYGRVTAVGGGETNILATVDSLTASAQVVVDVISTFAHIRPEDLHVGVGTVLQLSAGFYPNDATDTPARWQSSNPQVLTVDGSGLLRAKGEGAAMVTMTSTQGITTTSEIIVEPKSAGLSIDLTELSLERGDTYTLNAALDDEHGAEHHVEWMSSNPTVATVRDGEVTALSSGTTVISASADGFRASCTVRVHTRVQSVTLDGEEITLLQEQSAAPIVLSAEVLPADADDTKVYFVSDNTLVANVTEEGVVTMTGGYGTAVITAYTKDGAKDSFTVHVVLSEAEQ